MGILDDATAYVDFLCKNKLSPNQFLLCYLLYTEKMVRDDNKELRYKKAGNVYKYMNEGTGWVLEEIEDLIKNGYIIDTTKGGGCDIDRLILTDKFVELMFINANFAFEELFEIYPDMIKIEGSPAFLKGVDPEVVATMYNKTIKNSVAKHNEILELVKYGAENNLIKNRIDRFILGRMWESIKKIKDEKGGGYGKELY